MTALLVAGLGATTENPSDFRQNVRGPIVLGGGSIGLELGQASRRFGIRGIVVEALKQLLPSEEPEVSEALTRAEGRGSRRPHGCAHHARRAVRGPASRSPLSRAPLRAEQLALAAGRRPDMEEFGLEAAGVAADRCGDIEVDEFMRTPNPDVFTPGDVIGGPTYVCVA